MLDDTYFAADVLIDQPILQGLPGPLERIEGVFVLAVVLLALRQHRKHFSPVLVDPAYMSDAAEAVSA
jgi:hypothetical protein